MEACLEQATRRLEVFALWCVGRVLWGRLVSYGGRVGGRIACPKFDFSSASKHTPKLGVRLWVLD